MPAYTPIRRMFDMLEDCCGVIFVIDSTNFIHEGMYVCAYVYMYAYTLISWIFDILEDSYGVMMMYMHACIFTYTHVYISAKEIAELMLDLMIMYIHAYIHTYMHPCVHCS
jgi:hypothetical protein